MTTTLNSEKGRPRSGVNDMKAVLARAYGGPEVLTLEDVDRPKPEASQVLVEVHAAATNPSYWHRMEGMTDTVAHNRALQLRRLRGHLLAIVAIPSIVAEGCMALWLLLRGGKAIESSS